MDEKWKCAWHNLLDSSLSINLLWHTIRKKGNRKEKLRKCKKIFLLISFNDSKRQLQKKCYRKIFSFNFPTFFCACHLLPVFLLFLSSSQLTILEIVFLFRFVIHLLSKYIYFILWKKKKITLNNLYDLHVKIGSNITTNSTIQFYESSGNRNLALRFSRIYFRWIVVVILLLFFSWSTVQQAQTKKKAREY